MRAIIMFCLLGGTFALASRHKQGKVSHIRACYTKPASTFNYSFPTSRMNMMRALTD